MNSPTRKVRCLPSLLAFSRERVFSVAAVASLKEMPARQSTRLVLFASIQVRIRARSGALLCAETVRPPAHHRWRMPRHAHWSRSRTK